MSDTCMSHIENYWKTLTVTANESFEKGNLEQALLDYTDALFRAEVLNNHQQESLRLDIPFVQVFIISCNNLSATYAELENFDQAERFLKRVVYYLLHILTLNFAFEDEIHRELKKAALLLLFFNKEHNRPAEEPKWLQNILDISLKQA